MVVIFVPAIENIAFKKVSKQLGDGKLLSQLTKRKVVFNFRENDIINGGEGAPLTPILGTMIFTAWTILSSKELLPKFLSYPFDLYYTGLIGNIVMFILVYGIALTFSRNKTH